MPVTDHRIVGLAEVARLCGVSLSTVSRKVSKLRDFGAEKDSDGVWHVPVTAIEAVGWKLRADSGDTSRHVKGDVSVTAPDMSGEVSALREENADLRARLVRAEAEAEKWQMVAAERLQNLDDLRLSQRLLEAANAPAEVPTAPPKESEPVREETPAPVSGLMSRFRRVRGYGK